MYALCQRPRVCRPGVGLRFDREPADLGAARIKTEVVAATDDSWERMSCEAMTTQAGTALSVCGPRG